MDDPVANPALDSQHLDLTLCCVVPIRFFHTSLKVPFLSTVAVERLKHLHDFTESTWLQFVFINFFLFTF